MNTLADMLRNRQQGTAASGGSQMISAQPTMQPQTQQASMGPAYQSAMNSGLDAFQLAKHLRGTQEPAASGGQKLGSVLGGAMQGGAVAGPWGAVAGGLAGAAKSGALSDAWNGIKSIFNF